MTGLPKPKKHLGQNFLHDPRILNKITDACALSLEETVVEIGPGKGALTRLLACRVKKMHAVEFDWQLIAALRSEFEGSHVQIVQADFLTWDLAALPAPVKVIGNIPYFISTPIIEHLIEQRSHVTEAFLTVQKEFGERLAAPPGGKDYGALSCFIQYYADVKILFKIKNTCFTPPPKVDSCFVRLAFRPTPKYRPKDEILLFKMIRQAFTQRRKTIVNAISPLADKAKLSVVLTGLGLSVQARPETLSIQNYIDIADAIC